MRCKVLLAATDLQQASNLLSSELTEVSLPLTVLYHGNPILKAAHPLNSWSSNCRDRRKPKPGIAQQRTNLSRLVAIWVY